MRFSGVWLLRYRVHSEKGKKKKKSHNDWNRKGSALPGTVPITEKCVGSSPSLWLPWNDREPRQVSRSCFFTECWKCPCSQCLGHSSLPSFPAVIALEDVSPPIAWFFPIAGRRPSGLLSCVVARRTNADIEHWAGRGLEGQRTDSSRVFRFLSPALLPPLCSEGMPPTHARWSHLSPQVLSGGRGAWTAPSQIQGWPQPPSSTAAAGALRVREKLIPSLPVLHGAASEASP